MTLCLPGATVNHTAAQIHNALEAHSTVTTVVIHKQQQSEILKQDFLKRFKGPCTYCVYTKERWT